MVDLTNLLTSATPWPALSTEVITTGPVSSLMANSTSLSAETAFAISSASRWMSSA